MNRAETDIAMRTEDDPPPSRVAILAEPCGPDGPWLFSVGSRGYLSLAEAESAASVVIAAVRGAAS